MTTINWLMLTGGVGLGVGIGYLIAVFTQIRPLQEQLLKMRKRGFEPYFDVENEPEEDPSRHVPER